MLGRQALTVQLDSEGVTAAGEHLEFSAVDLFEIVDGCINRIEVFCGWIPVPLNWQATEGYGLACRYSWIDIEDDVAIDPAGSPQAVFPVVKSTTYEQRSHECA